MKTRIEIERELTKVRRALKRHREAGLEDDTDMLYGAQQALGWIVEGKQPMSRLQKTIEHIAMKLINADG